MTRAVLSHKDELATRANRPGVSTSFRLAYYAAIFVITGILIGVLYMGSLVN